MGKSTKRGILPTNAGRKYDGIDSNGKLWGNGGLVIASGSGTPEEGPGNGGSGNGGWGPGWWN